MRIEDMRCKSKETTIKNIEIGECFIDWEGDLCMKISENEYYNAVTLSTGLPWGCHEDLLVTPVKTHIVIESEE